VTVNDLCRHDAWLRSVQPTHPLHQAAVDSIASLIEANETLSITPQVAAELWNVATRPVAANGLGLSTDEARQQWSRLEGFFSASVDISKPAINRQRKTGN